MAYRRLKRASAARVGVAATPRGRSGNSVRQGKPLADGCNNLVEFGDVLCRAFTFGGDVDFLLVDDGDVEVESGVLRETDRNLRQKATTIFSSKPFNNPAVLRDNDLHSAVNADFDRGGRFLF